MTKLPIIKHLPVPTRYDERDMCEHLIGKPILRRDRCVSKAIYVLDGVKMCERHAGRELIMWHLKEAGVRVGRKMA